jgi:hypothetical protein
MSLSNMTLVRFLLLAFASVSLFAQEQPATPNHPPDPYGILKRLAKENPVTDWRIYLQPSDKVALSKSDYQVMTFDPSRVEPIGSARFRLWVRADFAEQPTYNLNSVSYRYDYSIALEEINCTGLQRHSLRTLLYQYVDADQDSARPVYDWKPPDGDDPHWTESIPGTIGEISLKRLCQQLKTLPQPKPQK